MLKISLINLLQNNLLEWREPEHQAAYLSFYNYTHERN